MPPLDGAGPSAAHARAINMSPLTKTRRNQQRLHGDHGPISFPSSLFISCNHTFNSGDALDLLLPFPTYLALARMELRPFQAVNVIALAGRRRGEAIRPIELDLGLAEASSTTRIASRITGRLFADKGGCLVHSRPPRPQMRRPTLARLPAPRGCHPAPTFSQFCSILRLTPASRFDKHRESR